MKVRHSVSLVKFKMAQKPCEGKQAQKSHFVARFYQRVGYSLTDAAYQTIKGGVRKSGEYLYPGKRGGAYLINYNGMELKVIYDWKSDSLITILPR